MSVTFRSVQYGNTWSTDTGAIVRQTSGGDTIIAPVVGRPEIETLTVSMVGFSRDEAEAFINFFQTVSGLEIVYTDHEDTDWQGFITTQQPVIEQYGRGCMYKISFTFEGKQI